MRSFNRASAFLERLAARWRRRRLATSALFLALALTPLEAILIWWARAPAWWLPAAAVVGLALVWAALRELPRESDLVRHLDLSLPAFEESSDLLVSRSESLSPLARLQRRRLLAVVELQNELSVPLAAVPGRALWRLSAISVAVSAAIWLAQPGAGSEAGFSRAPEAVAAPTARLSLSAEVQPPEYTELESRVEEGLEEHGKLSVVAGSVITWTLTGLAPEKSATLVFDDEELAMQADVIDGAAMASRRFETSRLYFLSISDRDGPLLRTPYARLEVSPDRAPEIRVTRPEPFLLLPEEGAERLVITAEITDDFAIGAASLVATVASGTGELVEFRERKFRFPRTGGNSRNAEHARVFDLNELGVAPGSELYFHVEASDNRLPRSNRGRSATYVVRRSGGPSASVGLGDGIPVFAVPDLFRSQRQIILDTERLLKEESTISQVELRRRSQEIGFDQRALRMRYGVLLGQEFVDGRPLTEEEEALEFEDDEDLGDLVGALPEGVVHEHDPQDLNTFFDSEVRERMRAALKEMWGAEGRLRSNEPRPALPFEYRALTLLKQAQERSRIYVQKVGFESPPLYPLEKRLTGDLADIASRRRSSRGLAKPSPPEAAILADLDRLAAAELDTSSALSVVRAARGLLLEGALELASSDLAALEAAAELEATIAAGDIPEFERIAKVRRELWRRLPDPELRPGRSGHRTSSAFERYLDELAARGIGQQAGGR